jgi:membrane fusion protein, multidrug efflux system
MCTGRFAPPAWLFLCIHRTLVLRHAPLLVAAIVIANTPGCSRTDANRASGGGPAPQPAVAPQVIVTAVEQRTVPVIGEFVGQTEAANTVEIRSQVTGFLRQIAFVEGATVKRGDLLFVIDPRSYQAALAQARAALAQAEAARQIAQRNLAMYEPLAAQHAISEQQLNTARAEAEQSQANVQAAQAQVAQAELNVGYTRITAPLTGGIGPAMVKIGGLVQAGSTLLDTIYSIDPMFVTFSASEQGYLNYQKRVASQGQNANPGPIRLVLADGTTYPETGTVNMVSPQVTTTTGTIGVRASFPNPKGLLKPGLFVRVRVTTQQLPHALVVPQTAIQQIQGTPMLYVVGADGTVQSRTVALGPVVENLQVVTDGVKAGDPVIVEGMQKVRPGSKVRAVTANQQAAS